MQIKWSTLARFAPGDRVVIRRPSSPQVAQIGVIEQVYLSVEEFYDVLPDGAPEAVVCHESELTLVAPRSVPAASIHIPRA